MDILVSNSINDAAPVHTKTPTRSHTSTARIGDWTLLITTDGARKIPEPICNPITRARPLRFVRIRGRPLRPGRTEPAKEKELVPEDSASSSSAMSRVSRGGEFRGASSSSPCCSPEFILAGNHTHSAGADRMRKRRSDLLELFLPEAPGSPEVGKSDSACLKLTLSTPLTSFLQVAEHLPFPLLMRGEWSRGAYKERARKRRRDEKRQWKYLVT
jgi:hypothetical protein